MQLYRLDWRPVFGVPEPAREKCKRQGVCRCKVQCSSGHTRYFLSFSTHPIQASRSLLSAWQNLSSRVGQRRTLMSPDEQLHPHPILQGAHSTAECRLSYVPCFSGANKAAVLRKG